MFAQRDELLICVCKNFTSLLEDQFVRGCPAEAKRKRDTATVTTKIETNMSYKSIERMRQIWAPYCNELCIERIFSSKHETRAAFRIFQEAWRAKDCTVDDRVAVALDGISIIKKMWSTPIVKKVLCPTIFTPKRVLLWVASLDARHRGKVHETIGTMYCANNVYNVLSYLNVLCTFICDGKEEDKSTSEDTEPAYKVLYGFFEQLHALKELELELGTQDGTVRMLVKTALDMMCQQFLGRAKGCTSKMAQGYSSSHYDDYSDPLKYCPENITLEFQDFVEVLRQYEKVPDKKLEEWAKDTGGCKGSPIDGFAWADRLLGVLHLRLCVIGVLVNRTVAFFKQRCVLDQWLDWLESIHHIKLLVIKTSTSVNEIIIVRKDGERRWLEISAEGGFYDSFAPDFGESMVGSEHAADWDEQRDILSQLNTCSGLMERYLSCMDVAKLHEYAADWNRQAVGYGLLFDDVFGNITPKVALTMNVMPRDWHECLALGIMPNFRAENANEKVHDYQKRSYIFAPGKKGDRNRRVMLMYQRILHSDLYVRLKTRVEFEKRSLLATKQAMIERELGAGEKRTLRLTEEKLHVVQEWERVVDAEAFEQAKAETEAELAAAASVADKSDSRSTVGYNGLDDSDDDQESEGSACDEVEQPRQAATSAGENDEETDAELATAAALDNSRPASELHRLVKELEAEVRSARPDTADGEGGEGPGGILTFVDRQARIKAVSERECALRLFDGKARETERCD
jgi:hypothetical protein